MLRARVRTPNRCSEVAVCSTAKGDQKPRSSSADFDQQLQGFDQKQQRLEQTALQRART